MLRNELPQLDSTTEKELALIDRLIAATRLYNSTEAVQELLEFTTRLREFAPFNAMLLHIQKPGITHAATAHDWYYRFGRVPKQDARPLVVLRTMGPVDFVFDILDTEGRDVPDSAFSFPALGKFVEKRFLELISSIQKEKIDVYEFNAGDDKAGYIELTHRSNRPQGKNSYQLKYNCNHPFPTKFVTVAHELAHLYLGHLGADRGRHVPDRLRTDSKLKEIEAEMTACLIAKRNGVESKSESYLQNFQEEFDSFGRFSLYAVMRAANAIETVMGISAQKLWNEKASAQIFEQVTHEE